MAYFNTWFFKQLPGYFKDNDSFKDSFNEGLLERYLKIPGGELDDEVVPYIKDFLDIIDIVNCDEKFLPLIGSILGYPPAIDGNNNTYRKILSYAVAIYKIKGTKKSFEILFNMLGMDIVITELVPKKKITYDMDAVLYDETHLYDSECDHCGIYNIEYTFQPGFGPISPTILIYINNIINWLQPINAKIGTITQLTL